MIIYRILLLIAPALLRIIAPFDAKLRRFRSLRIGEVERVRAAFRNRPDLPVLWFHAASAGEFEQAKPIIESLNGTEAGKRYYIVASFFSPSGFDAGAKYPGVDFIFNLPLDSATNARALLDAIGPCAIIYAKYDVWINLTLEAHHRGVKLFLVSGTLPEKSLRHRFPMKYILRSTYASLTGIYAISEADARRYRAIAGPRCGEIESAGDTRFDRVRQVIEEHAKKPLEIIARENGLLYFLAGSTYAISESKLLEAYAAVHAQRIRLIMVPHEIDPENIDRLAGLIASRGLQPIRYSQLAPPIAVDGDQVLIVDAFGVLAHLYRQADIVFVGGSFKGSVHSVLEPAVFGCPIITGPHIRNAYEAITMAHNGIIALCPGMRELAEALDRLASDPAKREDIGRRTKAFFDDNTGATQIIVSKIAAHL